MTYTPLFQFDVGVQILVEVLKKYLFRSLYTNKKSTQSGGFFIWKRCLGKENSVEVAFGTIRLAKAICNFLVNACVDAESLHPSQKKDQLTSELVFF